MNKIVFKRDIYYKDDPVEHSRDRERAEIAKLTAEYIARGGKIRTIPSSENFNANLPIRKTRKQHTAYQKRFIKIRTKGT